MAYPTSTDYFKPGDWNALCSMCGAKKKASQLVKNWQGQWRCPEHNEPRQPQDFVRSVPDDQSVPWSQDPTDTFIFTNALVTESSDLTSGNIYMIDTETFYPLCTET